ncbi:hypothetical protein Syun_007391 [Stephania yunnanensis]|uniref:Retrotransposon gag domain-containing protein n=1 Tax=Stephania yunnanensis TaxID=152371 RepID=A0AAP0PZB6_9MAGN
MPKLKIPVFSESANCLDWLFQIEGFFRYHQTPPKQRLSIASFYTTGDAPQWFHWAYSTGQLGEWSGFARDLEIRFGPSAFINHEASLFKLKQTEDIENELSVCEPQTLPEAMGMAKTFDEKSLGSRPITPKPFLKPFTNLPANAVPATANPAKPAYPLKRLTQAEMAARREKGLCYNCDEKFIPDHKCKNKQLLCIWPNDEPDQPTLEALVDSSLKTLPPVPQEPL